ncbi:class I SAM-dependent methyltransferase [Thermodesulfobacteriota bacterium]
MARTVCPPWIGYLLLNPLRKLLENPNKMLGPFIDEGMIVLEPGCGMGYFTLPLARMVGSNGRVVAVDVQEKMLSGLERRARKAGLFNRIELRRAGSEGLGVEDLSGQVDFAAAIHMVHEVPDQHSLITAIWQALKPAGKLLIVEPKGHVSQEKLEQSVAIAEKIGLYPKTPAAKIGARAALLTKPAV